MTLRLFRQIPALALAAVAVAVPLSAQAAKPVAKPAAKAPARPAAATDWTRTITLTPKGSFILGNPNAQYKLIEYMSYSCPHCADFARDATPELKAGWIKRGALSIEYRNFIRDAFDLSAALVARCGGAPRFLANHEAVFSDFEGWIQKAEVYAKNAPDIADRTAQLTDVADKLGFIALAGKNGVQPDAARKCIADPNAMASVLAMTAGAWDLVPNFPGTPTFFLNGKLLDHVHDWRGLKPLLPPLPAPGK